jgi:hypothetical protein
VFDRENGFSLGNIEMKLFILFITLLPGALAFAAGEGPQHYDSTRHWVGMSAIAIFVIA